MRTNPSAAASEKIRLDFPKTGSAIQFSTLPERGSGAVGTNLTATQSSRPACDGIFTAIFAIINGRGGTLFKPNNFWITGITNNSAITNALTGFPGCLLYTSPSPRD